MRLIRNITAQARTVFGPLVMLMLVMVVTPLPTAFAAGLEIGVGGGSCDEVKRQITRDWFEMRGFFRPDNKSMRRPSSRDFFCVSPAYTQRATHQGSRSASLTCYAMQGQKFCCDSRLAACAALN